MLNIRKQQLAEHCKTHSIPYVSDPTNSNLLFQRNWLAQHLLEPCEACGAAFEGCVVDTTLKEECVVHRTCSVDTGEAVGYKGEGVCGAGVGGEGVGEEGVHVKGAWREGGYRDHIRVPPSRVCLRQLAVTHDVFVQTANNLRAQVLKLLTESIMVYTVKQSGTGLYAVCV